MNDLTHVKGMRQIGEFLQTLPVKLEKNVLRGALRAGANVVKPVAQANAPKDTGEMARGMKVSTNSKRGVVMAKVKLTGKHAFLGPWLEYGTAAHRIVAKDGGWLFFGGAFAKAIDHPGITPRPFMLPALVSHAGPAVVAAANYMKARLSSKHGLDTADIEIEEV